MKTGIVEIAGAFGVLVGFGLAIAAAALVSTALALAVSAVLFVFAGVVAIYVVNMPAKSAGDDTAVIQQRRIT